MICEFTTVDNIKFTCDGNSLKIESQTTELSIDMENTKIMFEMMDELIESRSSEYMCVDRSINLFVEYERNFLLKIIQCQEQIVIFDRDYDEIKDNLRNNGVI